MAGAVGVTDETVASRLRRMFEVGAIAMTVVCDSEAIGFPFYALVRGRLGPTTGTVADLVDRLRDRREILAISETTGVADVIINVLASDLHALQDTIASDLRGIGGMRCTSVELVTEVCKQSLGISTLPIPEWSPADFPDPVIALDDLDQKLLRLLATDAHESNREFARRLGVSDGTVRARLARMEDAGLTRVVAMVDPVTLGEIGAVAHVLFTVEDRPDSLIEHLVDDDTVPTVYRCIGSCDVAAIVDAESLDELHRKLSREFRSIDGVESLDVAVVVDVGLHRSHLSHLR